MQIKQTKIRKFRESEVVAVVFTFTKCHRVPSMSSKDPWIPFKILSLFEIALREASSPLTLPPSGHAN